MDPQKLVNILTLQRNQAMDNVALLAMERDLLAEKVKELEARLEQAEQSPAPSEGKGE